MRARELHDVPLTQLAFQESDNSVSFHGNVARSHGEDDVSGFCDCGYVVRNLGEVRLVLVRNSELSSNQLAGNARHWVFPGTVNIEHNRIVGQIQSMRKLSGELLST